jgi:hypothetical protein
VSTRAPVNSETQTAKSIRQLQRRGRVGVDQLTRRFINARQASD